MYKFRDRWLFAINSIVNLCVGHPKECMLRDSHSTQVCSTKSNPYSTAFLSIVLPELLTHSMKDCVADDSVTDKENIPNASTQEVYCLCRQGEHGRMVACDNPNCLIEWYHYICVGITKKPKGKWYCPSCNFFLSSQYTITTT